MKAKFVTGLVFLLGTLACAVGLPIGATQASANGTAGVDGPASAGRFVNMRALPSVLKDPAAPSGGHHLTGTRPLDSAMFDSAKSEANARATANTGGEAKASPKNGASSPKGEFPTLTYSSTGQAFNPPDGGLAVGPTSELAAVNESLAIYNRSGSTLVAPVSFQSFFGVSNTIFDPRAYFDANNSSAGIAGGNGRFIMAAVTHDNAANTASYVLAVSQNDSPQSATSGWCTYKLNALVSGSTAMWPDFTTLGVDANNIYIGSNLYQMDAKSYFGGSFEYARLLVIPKSSVYPDAGTDACPTATSTDFRDIRNPDGSAAETLQPATKLDPQLDQATPMYLVNAQYPSGNLLAVRAITFSNSSPALGNPTWVSVGQYDMPANAPQPSGTSIQTDDTRLRMAYYRFGTIYTANATQTASQSTSPNPYSNVQWYAINPSSFAATTNDVSDPNVAYYIPGILPGCSVNASPCPSPYVALEFSGSGSAETASAFSMIVGSGPTVFQKGVPGYTLTGAWGDYPGLAIDPTDSTSVWMLGEYAAQTTNWGDALAEFSAPSGSGPTPTPTATNTATASPTPTVTGSPTTSSYASTIVGDHPNIYYRLDETGGPQAVDSSGNSFNGTYSSGVSYAQAGATSDGDGAVSGAGPVVKYSGSTGIPTGGSARSVECWFKSGTSQSNVALVAWGTENSTNLFAVKIYSSTKLKVTNWANDYYFAVPSGSNPFDGHWHYVAATFDGANLTLYLDGRSLGTVTASFATTLNGHPLTVASSTSGRYPYTGSIDEAAVYGTSLTAGQVSAHYNAAFTASSSTPTATPTSTSTAAATGTATATPTITSTATPTSTSTATPTATATSTATATPSVTATPTATVTSTYANAVLHNAPYLYYRLDETSGTTAADSSGSSRNAAYTSNAVLGQPGATSDGDAAVSGTGTVLRYSVSTGLPTGNGPLSAECWFKTSTSQSNVVLTAWGSESSNNLFAMMLYSSTQMKVSNWQNDYFFQLPAGANPFDGNWHHVVATFDGASLAYYYDGVKLGSQSAAFAIKLSSNGLTAGSSTGGSYGYKGSIDELAIYNSALTAAQVQSHFNSR